MLRCPVWFRLLVPSTLLFACGSDAGNGGDAGSGGGDRGGEADAGPAEVCASLHDTFSPIVPTVELVVDRSGSMRDGYGDSGESRWKALYATLMSAGDGIVAQLSDEVRFGLLLYSGNDGVVGGPCPTIFDIDPAMSNYATIDGLYANKSPGHGTPTSAAIARATDAVEPITEPGPKLLILATDGLPDTCDSPGSDGSVASRAAVIDKVQDAYLASIETFVIGVGPDVSADHLQDVANAGQGLEVGGPDNATYYQALEPAALVAAFQSIINGARGCTLTLDNTVNPDIAHGTVSLDGDPLAQGTDWRLGDDNGTIVLLGDACDILLSGGDHTVDATFTCPHDGTGGVE